jgi:hypothetical protein
MISNKEFDIKFSDVIKRNKTRFIIVFSICLILNAFAIYLVIKTRQKNSSATN